MLIYFRDPYKIGCLIDLVVVVVVVMLATR